MKTFQSIMALLCLGIALYYYFKDEYDKATWYLVLSMINKGE